MDSIKDSKGMALVEVIAALGVSVVVITSLVSLTIFTMKNATANKALYEATNIAQKQVEFVRAERDTSATWADFVDSLDSCSSGCYYNVTNGTRASGSGNYSSLGITYTFTITDVSGGILDAADTVAKVKATSTWNLSGQTKTTSVYTEFSAWRDL